MMSEHKNSEIAVFWAHSQPAIAGYIYSLVPVPQDADDVLQDVAVITVEKFEEYDRNRSFTAWANGIARKLILRYYSTKRSKHATLSAEAIDQIVHICDTEIESIHDMRSAMQRALKKCLTLLGGRARHILEMHYLHEISPSRIAQQLSITRNNVYQLLHRLRLSLRNCVLQQINQSNS